MSAKTRYVLSVIIDYILFIILMIFINSILSLDGKDFVFIVLLLLLLYWSQEVIFNGYSLVKFVFRIRVISRFGKKHPPILDLYLRRMIEIIYFYRILFIKVKIDIDSATNTEVLKSGDHLRPVDINKYKKMNIRIKNTNLKFLRLKGLVIDYLYIIWTGIIIRLLYVERIQQYLNIVDTPISMFISIILMFITIIYWIFRYLIYENKSIGMKKIGIEIFDISNKRVTRKQLIIKGFFNTVLFPIELVLLIFNIRLIGDRISSTYVRKIIE